jgi:cyclase
MSPETLKQTGGVMKFKVLRVVLVTAVAALFTTAAWAQDLGPHFKNLKDGIFVYAQNPADSNATIILTSEGVVLIDSGHRPPDSVALLGALKKLTPQPVRYLINTEPHTDHTTGHWLFSPPAIVVAHAGATESMKEGLNPERVRKIIAEYPDLKEMKNFRAIAPHIEFRDKMALQVGDRTFELIFLKSVHSEADTAIWMPKERIVFAAASVGVKRFSNLRSSVKIADTLDAIKMMRALNPEIVVPGHGAPGTVMILDDMEKYYTLLVQRVGAMVKQGKSLDEIKKDLRMPEADDWQGKDRFPTNIEAAYRSVAVK